MCVYTPLLRVDVAFLKTHYQYFKYEVEVSVVFCIHGSHVVLPRSVYVNDGCLLSFKN